MSLKIWQIKLKSKKYLQKENTQADYGAKYKKTDLIVC